MGGNITKSSYLKKVLVLGIAILFVATIIFPSTYGKEKNNGILNSSSPPTDYGSKEYWALIVAPWVYGEDPRFKNSSRFSAEKVYNCLVSSNNWQEDHIKMITCENGTKTNIIRGFRWLDAMEDENDVSVIYIATHGWQMSLFNIPLDLPPFDEADHCDEVLVTYWSFKYPLLTCLRDDELKFLVNQLESEGICIIIDSCYAGGFNDSPKNNSFKKSIFPMGYNRDFSADDFKKEFSEEIDGDNRVIIMATEEDEVGWMTPEGLDFTNILVKSFDSDFADFNNNGFISAEEAFNYTWFRLYDQNPTIYDGYNGELDLTVSSYEVYFLDNCESPGEWTTVDHTQGIGGDLWHLSEADSYSTSPTHCWYLGNENTIRYNNNMNNSLVSPEIKLGKNPMLSFFSKAETESHDFLMLDISANNWSSFITYNILPSDDWDDSKIYLNSYSEKTIQIRLRVVSDESIPFNLFSTIGFFMIDEILIYRAW